jgi:hypothetical protein
MKKHHYAGYVIAIILGAVLWINTCNKPQGDDPNWPPSGTKYLYDTVTYKFKIPFPVKEDTIIYDTITAKVDTSAIIKDYLATKVYTRSFEDSNIKVSITDSVRHNSLLNAQFNYQWKKPVATSIYYTKGFVAGVEANSDFGLGVSVGYLNHKNTMFDAAIYTDKSIRIGVRKVLRFRSRGLR